MPLAIASFHYVFRASNRTAHALSLMVFILIPIALRLYKARSGLDLEVTAWDVHFRRAALLRLDAIGYGVAMAYLKTYHQSVFSAIRWPAALFAVAGQCALWAFHPHASSLFMKAFSFPAHGIAYALAIPLLDSIRTLPKILSAPFEWVSRISYSMYLVNHLLVLLILQRTVPSGWSPAYAWLAFAAYFGATLALSHLIYTRFERPAMTIRDWFMPTRPSPV